MTPQERVQKLREEASYAMTGDGPTLTGSWFAEQAHPGSSRFEVIAEDEGSIIVADTYAPQAVHIARWDPAAAAKVLDLLEGLLGHYGRDGSGCGSCHTHALAVLDALDGGAS